MTYILQTSTHSLPSEILKKVPPEVWQYIFEDGHLLGDSMVSISHM